MPAHRDSGLCSQAAPVCNIMVSTPVISNNYIGLLIIYLPWRDGRLSWPSWLTHKGQFTQSDHLSTTDWEHIRESPSARGQRSNHRAMPTTNEWLECTESSHFPPNTVTITKSLIYYTRLIYKLKQKN